MRSSSLDLKVNGSGQRRAGAARSAIFLVLAAAALGINAQNADLQITLDSAPNPLVIGQFFTNTTTVRNNGPATATNVFVTNTFAMGAATNLRVVGISGVATQLVNLVPWEGYWRYDTNNVAQPPSWVTAGFDDSSWPLGQALFGYDTGGTITPSNTVLYTTNTANGQYITTFYFRTPFVVNQPVLSSALVRLVFSIDDGAVFHLNGQEIFRTTNMPSGTITHTTLATAAAQERVYVTNWLTLTNLLAGTNILAVEVHQAGNASSDIVFASQLDWVLGPYAVVQGNQVIASLGNLTNGQTATVVVSAQASAQGALAVQSQGTSATPDPTPANNSASTNLTVNAGGTQTDLALYGTSSPTNVNYGGTITYTLTVTNQSFLTASGVILTNVLPATVTYVSSTATQGACSNNAGVVTCDLGSIPIGGAATVTIVGASTVGSVNLTNRAGVRSVEPDSVLTNNFLTLIGTVGPPPWADLVIGMTDSPDPVNAGQNLTYSIWITNNGPVTATNVWVTNILPAGMSFVSATISNARPATVPVPLLTLTNFWRYEVTGTDLGTNWLAPGYDDSSWPSAPALFWRNTATIPYAVATNTPLPTNLAIITYYFRQHFDFPYSTNGMTLNLYYVVDDGAVFYLNGRDVFRTNMPAGAIVYTNFATHVGNVTNVTGPVSIPFTNLVRGDNVFAVEVHQSGNNSSDAQFATGLEAVAQIFPGYTTNGQNVVFTLGNMTNGQVILIRLVARPSGIGAVTNRVSVGSQTWDNVSGNNAASEVTTVLPGTGSDVALSGSAVPSVVPQGSNVVYTLAVTNNGSQTATAVTLTNVLPAGFAYVSAVSSQGSCSVASGVVVCNLGDMAMGAGALVTITAQAPSAPGWYTNSAVVSCTSTDPYLVNNSAALSVRVYDPNAIGADLSVVVAAAPTAVQTNQQVTFTLTVCNQGPEPATNVVVTNLLPSSFTYISASNSLGGSPTVSGSLVVFNLGTVASGTCGTLTIVARANLTGYATNTVTVTSSTADNTPANNSGVVVVAVNPADMATGMSAAPDPVMAFSELTYTIRVTNNGPAAATGVVLTNLLPSGVQYVSASASQGSCAVSAGVVTCNLSNMTVGGTAVVSVVVRPQVPGLITNVAGVFASQPDANWTNNVALAITQVRSLALADLTLMVADTPDPVIEGARLTNRVIVINNGPTNATGLLLSNIVQGNASLVDVVFHDGGSVTNLGNAIICALNNLAPGGVATVDIITIPVGAGRLTNLFSVSSAQTDTNLTDNSAFTVTVVQPLPVADLMVSLSGQPNPVGVGETLTYTILVTNLGPLAATGVRLTNTLPPGLTGVTITNSQGGCSNAGGVVLCDLGTIEAAHSALVRVSAQPSAPGYITNRVEVRANEPDLRLAENSAQLVISVLGGDSADLVLSATPVPQPVYAGQELYIRLNLTNFGPLSATGVRVTNTAPPGAVFVRASSTIGSYAEIGGQLVFDVGTLPRQGYWEGVVVLRPTQSGLLTNLTAAGANEPDATANRIGTPVNVVAAADLVITVQKSSDPVAPNTVFTYTVTIINLGPCAATNVSYYQQLPSGATNEGVFVSQGSTSSLGDALLWSVGILSNGASATMDLDMRFNDVGTTWSYCSVISDQYDPVLTNNEALVSVGVIGVAGGQGIVITRSTNASAMAAALTASGATGLRVTGVSLSANRNESGTSSGLYTVTATNNYQLLLPGVVISTGDVGDYGSGPNTQAGMSTQYGRPATQAQEALLDPITGGGTNNFTHYDVTQLNIQFDMMPGYDRVTFRVVFGSEEYPEYVHSEFIDGFGIYLDGTNIAYAAGAPVNINHPDMRELPETELDGVIVLGGTNPVMTFSAPVVPGSSNHLLTFIVADTSDSALDTTVFISALEGMTGPNADVALTMSAAPEPVPLGSLITYTIMITNSGPDTATNVVLTDIIPEVLTNISFNASTGSCSVVGGNVVCNLGNIARRGSAVVTISGRPAYDTRFVNTASVQAQTIDLRTGNNSTSVVSTAVQLGSFYNTVPVEVRDGALAAPYPSVIHVSGLTGVVERISVALLGITHTFPQDISVLLQGPQGQQVVLMAAAGGGNDIMEVTLRFEDSATNSLPQYGQIVSGVYRPSNYAPTNYFPGVASLAPPARGSALSAFRRTDPNGDWLLYVVDTQGGDSGMITGGWSLRFVTAPELVVRVVGQNFVISWPDMSGYVVEGSSTLQPGSWQVIAASQTVSNGRRSVTIPLASGFKFFRLRQ